MQVKKQNNLPFTVKNTPNISKNTRFICLKLQIITIFNTVCVTKRVFCCVILPNKK